MFGGCGSEEEEVALGDVDEGVQDGGFGAVEAGGAEGVDDEGPEEGAVEVVAALAGHGAPFFWVMWECAIVLSSWCVCAVVVM